jgi:hypothetical protein
MQLARKVEWNFHYGSDRTTRGNRAKSPMRGNREPVQGASDVGEFQGKPPERVLNVPGGIRLFANADGLGAVRATTRRSFAGRMNLAFTPVFAQRA